MTGLRPRPWCTSPTQPTPSVSKWLRQENRRTGDPERLGDARVGDTVAGHQQAFGLAHGTVGQQTLARDLLELYSFLLGQVQRWSGWTGHSTILPLSCDYLRVTTLEIRLEPRTGTSRRPRTSSAVGFSLVSLGLGRLLGLVISWRRADSVKELEIVVLRHQVRLLRRQLYGRVRYQPVDRRSSRHSSRWVPRRVGPSSLVTPDAVVRWLKGARNTIWPLNWHFPVTSATIRRGPLPPLPRPLPAPWPRHPLAELRVRQGTRDHGAPPPVRILERQLHGRIRYRPVDRAVLAALSRLLPRARWRSFLVTPDTLVRWHRELARRQWRRWRARQGPGRPPMSRRARRADRSSRSGEPSLGMRAHPG